MAIFKIEVEYQYCLMCSDGPVCCTHHMLRRRRRPPAQWFCLGCGRGVRRDVNDCTCVPEVVAYRVKELGSTPATIAPNMDRWLLASLGPLAGSSSSSS